MRAFCSFNPLKPYALEELERCSKDPQLHYGLKLHFGNSDVDLDNPANVAQVRRVFTAANGYHMPIVVHMHTSIDNHRKYGADEARTFLDELLPAASDIPVQIAHLAGSGGYDAATDSAMGVFMSRAKREHDTSCGNSQGDDLHDLDRIAEHDPGDDGTEERRRGERPGRNPCAAPA